MSIPEIKDIEKGGIIPTRVSELKTEAEPEMRPFFISYAKYNDKLCQIGDCLVKNCQKKALTDLKKIGRDIMDHNDFRKNGIDSISIRPVGDYKKLFSGLHEDVELFEHKLQSTARIFYFLNNVKKIFYIVAITQTHFETEKVRR